MLRLCFATAVLAVITSQASELLTPLSNTGIGVLLGVQRVLRNEMNELERRLQAGKDNTVASFMELEPAILEAGVRPLDELAERIAEPSRRINWIQIIAKQRNLDLRLFRRTLDRLCPYVAPKDCSPDEKYRRVDGQCNNLDHTLWGAGFTPMARDLPAQYDTGIVNPTGIERDDLPRQTGRISPLPGARLVSNVVHRSSSTPPESLVANMAFVFFGQMTAHDVVDTAPETGARGSVLGCSCDDIEYRGCASVPIPQRDFFRQFQRTCLGMSRSKEVTGLDCRGGREQLNRVSSFVDGNNMYGHTKEILEGLRAENGKLKVSEPNQLPFTPHPNMIALAKGINFLDSGDQRVSEVIGLTAITTILHREHNRLAEKLAGFERFKSISDEDERSNAIFEEARKISIAIKQHITYNEFLRLAIGPKALKAFGLEPQADGFFEGYNSTINPSMTNEVIVSAQRFGHSLLRSLLTVRDENFTPAPNPFGLRRVFFRPNFYLQFENGFQRGVLTDRAEVCDRQFSDEVRNHLFETEEGNGEDLIARNIQRARDHGVASYNAVRRSLELSTASDFTSGGATGFEHLSDDVVRRLAMVYDFKLHAIFKEYDLEMEHGHPDDVDLFTGGISETPLEDGIVGTTYAALLGRQFQKLRAGDRFWFENEKHGFKLDQLNEIRKVTMARLMCDNIVGITDIQPEAFVQPTVDGNQRKSCGEIPQMDFTKFE